MDPVRFLSNNSTGTMGRYLVGAARRRGHRVDWVECPKKARTALELRNRLRVLLPKNDVLVMAAAVCDVRPRHVSRTKIKKDMLKTISLIKNPDILAGLGRQKKKSQVFIGFGLESGPLVAGGAKKLSQKNLDLIVLQRVRQGDTPFGDKAVRAVILGKNRLLRRFGSVSKRRLSDYLIRQAELLKAAKAGSGL